MEFVIRIGAPVYTKTSAISFLLSNNEKERILVDKKMSIFFLTYKNLLSKYFPSKQFWRSVFSSAVSPCGTLLAVIMDDDDLLVFDFNKITIKILHLPVMEKFLLCGISVTGKFVVIGGNFLGYLIH